MHPRLTGILRTIHKTMPSDITPRQAWEIINPGGPFLRNSFWYVLSGLQFAKSDGKQVAIAEWIFRQKERIQKAGKPWPPAPIKVKPAVIPQPKTLTT